jgi:hypothetical protein
MTGTPGGPEGADLVVPQRGLDRERGRGYMGAANCRICKTPGFQCKTSEKNTVNSVTSVGNGVTVAQQTLTLFV